MASDTKDDLIVATGALLQGQGYHGTSLSEILARSGAPRGSMYFHFPGGKEELALEATRRGVEEVSAAMRASFAHAPDPASGVRAFFRDIAAYIEGSDYALGCPVAPLLFDDIEATPDLARLCRDALATWEELFREAFVAGGIDEGRAGELAAFALAAEEGAILMAKAQRSTEPLLLTGEMVARAVEA